MTPFKKFLQEENADLRAAGEALYKHAVDVRIQCDGFMYAWQDKFSPDMKEEMKTLRVALFAACEKWKKAKGGRR